MKTATKIWVGCLMLLSMIIGTAIGRIGWADGEAIFLLLGWFWATLVGIMAWSIE